MHWRCSEIDSRSGLLRQTTCRGLGVPVPQRRRPGHVLKLWEGGERETKFIPSLQLPIFQLTVNAAEGNGGGISPYEN